ncbi:MAG TPA: protein kinase, partial [Planctomycetota bacterium]|nr:protein kinase [Planctomycetota bacterium]
PQPLSADIRNALPGYELEAEVARGRTGVVYRAHTLGMDGREVLVKLLDPALSSSENALQRFEAEAQAVGRIDHPNVVRLIETGSAEGRHFYTMEHVEGHTLDDLIRIGRLAPREAAAIGVQVARGLAIAHGTRIVHRDIAPASIMVTPDGVAKIFDFAFLKTEEEMPSLTNIGDVVGDLRYSSPEQAGSPRAADHRSDLYALGATLYHAIAGRPPIEGKNYLDTYRRIVSEAPQPLVEIIPEVRPKLANAVMRLLDKDPLARFQSAGDLAQALSEAVLEAVIAARKKTPPAGVGIGADFRGIELLELIQVIGGRRASGILTVTAETEEDGEGAIRFRQGDIVDAKTATEPRMLEAALHLLDLRAGTFAFRADPNAAPGNDEPLKASELALEALRRRN